MSTPNPDGLQTLFEQGRMKVGNQVLDSAGAAIATAAPLHVNASGVLVASLPTVFATGATNTGISVLSVSGSATGSVDDLMHLTLVKGSNATATIAGYMRMTVTDANGVITNGDYYSPFYTLG